MKHPDLGIPFYEMCVQNFEILLGTSVESFISKTANAVNIIRDCENLLEKVKVD